MQPHLWVKSNALFSEHRRRLLYSGTETNISRWLTRTLSSLTIRPIFSFHSLRIFNPNNDFGKRQLRHSALTPATPHENRGNFCQPHALCTQILKFWPCVYRAYNHYREIAFTKKWFFGIFRKISVYVHCAGIFSFFRTRMHFHAIGWKNYAFLAAAMCSATYFQNRSSRKNTGN